MMAEGLFRLNAFSGGIFPSFYEN